MSKQIIENNLVIKINLENIDQSANQPQLKKFLAEGWRVTAMVPVDDNGVPTLILILSPPMSPIRVDFPLYPLVSDSLIIILLLSIFLTLIFSGGGSV